MHWLPTGFLYPSRLDLPTGHHLRPIREDDVDRDYPAVMGSRERLWEVYGEAWGWPDATMTWEQDRADLAWHVAEMIEGLSFNYAILDAGEDELFGSVYIDPPAQGDEDEIDAVVSWWVVDHAIDSPLDWAVEDLVPSWLEERWPFRGIRYGV